MDALFSDNGVILFLIACIAIISYTNFKDNQRMFLLYLFSYGVAVFSVFRIRTSLLLLLSSTFVFLEYLTEDTKKLEIVIKFRYKVYDYIYLMLFQYDFLLVFLAFLSLFLARHSNLLLVKYVLYILSVVLLAFGEQRTVSQPFKIKSFVDTMKVFDEHPPYLFKYHPRMDERFRLLCAFEDKSYFYRSKSYSCFSFEYLRYKWNNLCSKNLTLNKMIRYALPKVLRVIPTIGFNDNRIYVRGRGYSTPEMQLLRTIGIVRGYERYKIRRKIYEIVYTKILFSSLKEYHQANTYLALDHYREYLLSIYFQSVLTRIKNEKYSPMSLAFSNQEDITNWSLEGLFITCLGLSFREVTDDALNLYEDTLSEFEIDRDSIYRLYNKFPEEKFPLSDK